MSNIKNISSEIKLHPGQAGSDDDSRLKRTKVLEVNLSPFEYDNLKDKWRKTNFNSMAKFARYRLFGGTEHQIDLHFEEKRDDRILAAKFLSELNRQGKNLNQIAKQLNSKTDFTKQEVQLALKDLNKALKNIEEIKEEFFNHKNK
ncbi:plasmid mobilization protein [Undibacterium sp. Xuan67W]|uniref:plasmid mobilization protein n=1 Tax=Undibacterium sp. Xuan67W TaxID=3413057 RepID=UPI003BF3BC0E